MGTGSNRLALLLRGLPALIQLGMQSKTLKETGWRKNLCHLKSQMSLETNLWQQSREVRAQREDEPSSITWTENAFWYLCSKWKVLPRNSLSFFCQQELPLTDFKLEVIQQISHLNWSFISYTKYIVFM